MLQSDNDVEFVNDVMKALKFLSGIDECLISSYHHRSNGIAERAIQSTWHAVYKAMHGGRAPNIFADYRDTDPGPRPYRNYADAIGTG